MNLDQETLVLFGIVTNHLPLAGNVTNLDSAHVPGMHSADDLCQETTQEWCLKILKLGDGKLLTVSVASLSDQEYVILSSTHTYTYINIYIYSIITIFICALHVHKHYSTQYNRTRIPLLGQVQQQPTPLLTTFVLAGQICDGTLHI